MQQLTLETLREAQRQTAQREPMNSVISKQLADLCGITEANSHFVIVELDKPKTRLVLGDHAENRRKLERFCLDG